MYGVEVTNLNTGKTPKASKGKFSLTSNIQVGDIGYQLNSSNKGHWFIIKSVNGNGTYTVIEQNWKWKKGSKVYCKINRKVSKSTKGFKVFRWSLKPTLKYVNSAPKNLKATKGKYGDTVTFTWSKVTNATNYWVIFEKDGKRIIDKNIGNKTSYAISTVGSGKYVAKINGYIPSKSDGPKASCSISISAPSGTKTVSTGAYHIVSALESKKTLNIRKTTDGKIVWKENGANIQLWDTLNDPNHVFNVVYLGNGNYKIQSTFSGKSLDVAAGGLKSTTNVQQWDYTGVNQQWVIKSAGNDSFYIISKRNGHYLDVSGGKANNDTNVWTYNGNGSAAQKWKFVAWSNANDRPVMDGRYHIVSALDNKQNVNVKSYSMENGGNIQIWESYYDPKQTFNVKSLNNGYYKITSTNSVNCLDVASASVKSGANVHQWDYVGADQQQWILKDAGNGYYYIIAKNSGLYLDVSGGKAVNGTNIQVYIGNNSNAQKWKFVPYNN